ncbi:Fc.00g017270.m01.CDS01 [Cosmosporella sp. VM-42]
MSTNYPASTLVTSTVALPPLRVLLKQENLQADATLSLCLDLPEELPHATTVDGLVEVVKEKNLWIARVGPCFIEVSLAINGDAILENSRIESLVRSIQNLDVRAPDNIIPFPMTVILTLLELWDRLGLRLEYYSNPGFQLPGLMCFSIQHPDLMSAMVAPTGALTARFRALKMSINVSKPSDERPGAGRQKRGKKRKKTANSEDSGERRPLEGDDIFPSIDPDDLQAIEHYMLSFNIPSGLTIEDVLGNISSSNVFEVLLEQVMLRPNRRFKGLQVFGCPASQCLTQLAPAVFHIPYLKTISERASLLPIISTSLARMKNAESPSLRQKVTELSSQSPRHPLSSSSSAYSSEWERVVQGIEKCTWDVLLQNSRILPLKDKRRVTRGEGQATYQGRSSTLNEDVGAFLSPPVSLLEDHAFGIKIDEGINQVDPMQDYHSPLIDGIERMSSKAQYDPVQAPPLNCFPSPSGNYDSMAIDRSLTPGYLGHQFDFSSEIYDTPTSLTLAGADSLQAQWPSPTSDYQVPNIEFYSYTGDDFLICGEDMTQSQVASTVEGMSSDLGYFQSLDHWLNDGGVAI